MKCPYCGNEINITAGFCPECGQNITNNISTKNMDTYWSEVNKKNINRFEEQKQIEKKIIAVKRTQNKKTIISVMFTAIVIVAMVVGFLKYQSHSQQMIAEVTKNLVGQTFTAHDEHMEGLGWIYHEYWQLTFKDATSLDYAYIETVGPRDDDEKPDFVGTYEYSVSRSITGSYSIKTNGATYKLYVNDENIPKSISK